MSRRLVYDALRSDPEIRAFIPEHMVLSNWALDKSPTRESMFIILRWGADAAPRFDRGNFTTDFTVWVHMPKEVGVDYFSIQKVLERVKAVLTPVELETGDDGWEVTSIRSQGGSSDMQDREFDTSTRSAMFTMLSHPVPSG